LNYQDKRQERMRVEIKVYQDKRQERMRVEIKVYLKQIKSDAIYSDNHGLKKIMLHIDNKERS